MPININEFFERGGRELVDLLEYCVLSINTDALLLYLIREYRFQPLASGAIALHDLFCAVGAPARISEITVIPHQERRIERMIADFRPKPPTAPETPDDSDCDASDSAACEAGDREIGRPADFLPPRYLFDPIANQLTSGSETKVAELEKHYNPKLTPVENLPGRELSGRQRAFVNDLWTPIIRPRLVSAGFWRIATIA